MTEDLRPLVKCLCHDISAARDTLLTVGAGLILDAGGGMAHLEAWRTQYGGAPVRDVADAIGKMEAARRYGRPVLGSFWLAGAA